LFNYSTLPSAHCVSRSVFGARDGIRGKSLETTSSMNQAPYVIPGCDRSLRPQFVSSAVVAPVVPVLASVVVAGGYVESGVIMLDLDLGVSSLCHKRSVPHVNVTDDRSCTIGF
jgi:hypothetical protein